MIAAIPFITVLLCTYNDEAFIAETIQSILGQTYKNFEFIILNDGSTDGTNNIIHSFVDERIKYLEHSENKGLEEAKNWGLDEAKGKYIAYIDGDDISEPDRLRVQMDYMEAHPETGICSTRKVLFGLVNKPLAHVEHDLELRMRALFGTPMEHPSCMIRTEVLRKHNIKYRKNFPVAEDYPFMIDLMEITQAHCIQIPLIRKRIHDQRVSVLKKEIQNESAARASQLAFKVLLGIEGGVEERFAIKRCFVSKSNIEDLTALGNIRSKITLNGQLSSRDIAFRQYILDHISKSIFKIHSQLKRYQSIPEEIKTTTKEYNKEFVKQKVLKNENDALHKSLSWKITAPLRTIVGVLLNIIKKRQ